MLNVGAAKVCINPSVDMYPFPPIKGDWGAGEVAPVAVYDDMNCRAIAIENGTKKILFLSYELPRVPNIPELAGLIAKETDFPQEDIIITATHNHTGVFPHAYQGELTQEEKVFIEKYKLIQIEKGIEVAKKAVDNMRPARYGYGESESYINTNRDLQTPFGYWVEARNLAGYSDKTLAIVKFVDMNGKLIAALLNHGTHCTCAFLMKDADGQYKTSGNLSGIACCFAEEHYGDDAVVLWTSGAAGNQNPLLSHGMQYEYPDGYSTSISYPDGVGYMQMEYMGRMHGADAVKGIDAIVKYSSNMPMTHLRRNVLLPAQKVKGGTSGEVILFRAGGNGLRTDNVVPILPQYPEMEDDINNSNELKMQVLILGDIAIILANAELYAQIGRDMKKASPYRKTFVVTHSDTNIGYVLDKSSVDEKVFQAFTWIKPGSSDELILNCENELFDEVLKAADKA